MTRASLDKSPRDVAAMFDRTSERYDLMNALMAAGRTRMWRRETARAVDAYRGERVLDIAAGTGTSSAAFTERGASCVACDFSLGMLEVGRRRRGGASAGGVTFVAGDALRLPFADESFDAVTISFGLRNIADTAAALREMRRVTRPGGRLVVCEFSHLAPEALDRLYRQYLIRVIPLVARAVSSNPDSYDYLAESIQDWPDQPALAALMRAAGWRSVAWRNLTFGVVALHRGYRL
ncbi:demethylmenaquinone methyltransferase [Allonocardiopsis opalescens]|uniref:Demethylmenaquinone methyltransferase n=1 Tax=Allonocardiopsis opalescens TaxID=1144618 RepID=A0A2T0Q7Z4_9ACTN|nr:demethylmenaquinone methyltransferase [Allonocardiopsis opalescens]PRX99911.1 demethylmenaquinone methyltransferase/2-methoxy-6-polyprenyl-1,4-benzoquinol methylase [Allonocardiopsis opalescens]